MRIGLGPAASSVFTARTPPRHKGCLQVECDPQEPTLTAVVDLKLLLLRMPLEKEEIGDPDAGLVEAACVIIIFICSITRAQSVSDYLDQGFTTQRFGKTGLLASPRVEHKNGKVKKKRRNPWTSKDLFGKRKRKVEARFQKQQGTKNASHTKAKNTGLQEGNSSIRLRINSEASEVKK